MNFRDLPGWFLMDVSDWQADLGQMTPYGHCWSDLQLLRAGHHPWAYGAMAVSTYQAYGCGAGPVYTS